MKELWVAIKQLNNLLASAGNDRPRNNLPEKISFSGHPIVVNFSTSRAEPNVLTVTWNHASQEWCSLTYDVHYVSTTNGQFVTVSEPEARFLFEYCDPVAILIVPIAANGFHLPSTGVDATQCKREIIFVIV